jgi:hypothetical protein
MPAENSYGVLLTQNNLKMMAGLIPRLPRLLGLGYAPRICMTELMAPDELARVGLKPLLGHKLLKAFLGVVLRLGQRAGEHRPFAARLARVLLQGMVDVDRRGEVSFSVPLTRLDLRGPEFE